MITTDFLIVGAGIYGSVIAERIANDLNREVIVLDRRPHIGGNCYSEIDDQTGIEYHKYGTHIFHTSIRCVWDYISQFTEFNGYHHQVLTSYKDIVYQMPFNLETINAFYATNLKPFEVSKFLKKEIEKENYPKPANMEEKAISLIGRPLYEAFIEGYTTKQWGKSPRELPASIVERLPVRHNYVEDYFNNSRWQGIPLEGYTKVFENLLSSKKIKVELETDFFDVLEKYNPRHMIIYSGSIDRYFNFKYGKLEWRSVRFEREVAQVEDFQGTSVMNYAELDVSYTRIHEPRHLHPEREYANNKTLLFKEYPGEDPEEPYYPINSQRNNDILAKYQDLARSGKVLIGGRLGGYAYHDIDMTIASALEDYTNCIQSGI